jgi:hypothetical protein
MFCDGHTCPECDIRCLYRSHAKGLDWVFHLFGYRPMRCHNCCQRFYTQRLSEQSTKSPQPGMIHLN